MSQIIDRRSNAKKKSLVNRQRFLRRFRNQIKKAVSDAVHKRSITDMDAGETIPIPTKDIEEPRISHGQGGTLERALPGNDQFSQGDTIARPESQGGDGGDGEASNAGEGTDDFVFSLSREEFLDIYFDELELPYLIKKQLLKTPNFQTVRAGYTTSGVPTNIHVVRSMRQATGRRIALRGPHKKRLAELEVALAKLQEQADSSAEEIHTLQDKIEKTKRKIKAIPYIDSLDLRYNNRVRVPKPATSAVMFCLMDVSGSMDEAKKEIAKRFFILLYLFLTRSYENIELVFIRHHTSAKEVDEQAFFYSRETGGTVVSSALELMVEIMQERYSTDNWNIYAAQASDGDNWNADSPYCQELLNEKIMPLVQYFAYVEIMPRHHQSLWEVYQNVEKSFDSFNMRQIDNIKQIYPIFRDLFTKKVVS